MNNSLMNTEVGARLRHRRQQKRKSRVECAEYLGLSASAVAYYEQGKRTIKVDQLAKLAVLLDTTVDYFLGSDLPKELTKREINLLRAFQQLNMWGQIYALRAVRGMTGVYGQEERTEEP